MAMVGSTIFCNRLCVYRQITGEIQRHLGALAHVCGHRTDGTNYSLLASTRKVGMAFGGGLAAFALAWGGYELGATAQSPTAELGIRVAAGLAPAVILLVAVGIMRWYPLTDDAHARLVLTIQERSGAR